MLVDKCIIICDLDHLVTAATDDGGVCSAGDTLGGRARVGTPYTPMRVFIMHKIYGLSCMVRAACVHNAREEHNTAY
jgi:hypothetical protein